MAIVEEIAERAGLGSNRPGIHVLIDGDRCAGCQECLVRCPTHALSLDHGRWQVEADDALCVGCRQCERTCPFHAIEVEGPVLSGASFVSREVSGRSLEMATWETRPGIASLEEARAEAERCLDCLDPTCSLGCPAHNDIPGFVRALAAGDIQGARDVLAQTTVFPEICSRVCDQATQCEGACSWTLAGGRPVAIGLLERFVADRATPKRSAPTTHAVAPSVAVIGAGPGGVAAALGLRQAGAAVVLYERRARALGVLDWGIPAFTLPDEVAAGTLGRLRDAGVKVELGVDVGTVISLEALRARHDSVVLATGASQPLPAPVPTDGLAWVEDSTAFLARAKTALRQGARLPDLAADTRLLVLGAGNTAMDVARSAARLGVTAVVCVDWMDERFARVRPDELEQARAEGVRIRFRTALAGLAEGASGERVALLAATRQRSGRERPRQLKTPPERLSVDRVVVATGYRVEAELGRALSTRFPLRAPDMVQRIAPRAWMASGLTQASGPVPTLALEREWHLTRAAVPVADQVWVVGDTRTGPATVVAAMAQGLAVARAIAATWPGRADADPRSIPLPPPKVRPTPRALPASIRSARAGEQKAAVAVVGASETEAEGTLFAGAGLVAYGVVSCLTIVGLPLGVPMIAVGLILMLADVVLAGIERGVRGAGAAMHRPPRRRRLAGSSPSWAVRR